MGITADEPPIGPRKRRGWRYSLRALMVVVTLLAGICAWVRYHMAEQRRQTATIRAMQPYVDACHEIYLKTDALAKADAQGSEDLDWYGSEASYAKAELELAKGDKDAAVQELRNSLRFAYRFVLDTSVSMGESHIQTIFERSRMAASQRMKVELKLIELSPDAIDDVRSENEFSSRLFGGK